MNIVFGQADLSDIDELIRMRIAYMIDDFGSISDEEREGMEKQLPDYFARKLGTELIAFVAKDGNRIVSVAYLHIIVRRHIVGGANRTLFSLDLPPRLCRTGT